ncbi:hypothetical protein ACFLSW_05590 [Candidatus Bipolaricaulota bacterium]
MLRDLSKLVVMSADGFMDASITFLSIHYSMKDMIKRWSCCISLSPQYVHI